MNYCLKFFSRTVHFSQSEELFINKYTNRQLSSRDRREEGGSRLKFEAMGFLTYLQMTLFSDPETGFYYDLSGNRFQLLANKMGIGNKTLKQYLDWCFEYSLLDENMYKKYNILTSLKMQDDYSRSGLERRQQKINMDFVYPDCSFTQKYKIALQKYKNALQNSKNVQQNSGDKTKQDDINIDNKRDTNLSIEAFNLSLEKFKQTFPDKKCDDEIPFVQGIDFEALTTAINQSPQFLLKYNKPMNWKWCINNYEKIVSGEYRKFPESNDKLTNIKPKQNYQNREYTSDELNSLFDDVSKVEIKEIL